MNALFQLLISTLAAALISIFTVRWQLRYSSRVAASQMRPDYYAEIVMLARKTLLSLDRIPTAVKEGDISMLSSVWDEALENHSTLAAKRDVVLLLGSEEVVNSFDNFVALASHVLVGFADKSICIVRDWEDCLHEQAKILVTILFGSLRRDLGVSVLARGPKEMVAVGEWMKYPGFAAERSVERLSDQAKQK